MARRKIAPVLADFSGELRALARLDVKNQSQLSASAKRAQLVLSTEAIFFRAFRAYENFLEDAFVLYTLEKPTLRGQVPTSYLSAENFNHARELLRSGKRFLDWTNPETVIERAETFVKGGGTVKSVVASAKQDLLDMKAVRNHIAHNSEESRVPFEKLIRRVRGTTPIRPVQPGDHLLAQVRGGATGSYYLDYYLNRLSDIAEAIAEK
ncbi:MAG: hypothetical protein R3F12_10015 [Lysobacteraceae bacterium]